MHLDNLTATLLWRMLAIFLLIGSLSGIALALLLIFKSHLIERVNGVANRWISVRRISRVMDHSLSIERWFYRHHRPMGLLLTLGACYILFYFGWRFDQAAALQSFATLMPNKMLLGAVLQAAVYFALIGAGLSLPVSLVVLLRPSLLRGVEVQSNQWVSSRRATKPVDQMHGQVDRFVESHAQRVGWLLLVGSSYLFFVMFRALV